MRWTSSSAPALPLAASRSASAVKPEMSTETSEPSSVAAARRVGLGAPGADEARQVGREQRVGPRPRPAVHSVVASIATIMRRKSEIALCNSAGSVTDCSHGE